MVKENKPSLLFKIARLFSAVVLKLMGWKTSGEVPKEKKYVMIGYPHTSNWDALIGLMVYAKMGVRLNWLAKQSLFKGPLGWFLKLTGAIPVNRQQSQNFIQYSKQLFDSYDQLVLTLSPEGTRQKTEYWRTGFYYIALNAKVPIALAFLDYSTRTGGFGPVIWPSGNIEEDLKTIRAFYKNFKGKYPEKMGKIQLKPGKEPGKHEQPSNA